MPPIRGQVSGWLSPLLERQRMLQAGRFIPEGADILDLGCGRAQVLEHVGRVRSYVGVDILDDVLAANRGRYPAHEFHRADLERERPPLGARRFQIVLLLAVLEHFAVPERALKNIAGYLDREGKIILTTPHPSASGIHALGARLGLFSREASEDHARLIDERRLRELARDADLRLIVYERFQLGFNQVAVVGGRADEISAGAGKLDQPSQ